jgi:hypothetical protein
MPMASPSSSARSDGAVRTPLALWGAVLAGPAALLGLAAAGGTNTAAAIPLALVSGVAGYALARRTLNRPADPAAPIPVPAALDQPPPFGLILETLPDPLMVIAAEEADDLTGRRFVFANAAARELFKLQPRGGLLVSALRSPQVLEAVDESLFGGVRRSVDYVGGGAQGREWAAPCAPLGLDERGSRLALLVLSDETDARRSERTRADFLANASHELRTPLASLSGFIETLRGHAKDDVGARDKFLGIMQAQAERMARLIDDLMSCRESSSTSTSPRWARSTWPWPRSTCSTPSARPRQEGKGRELRSGLAAARRGGGRGRPRPDRPGHPEPGRQRHQVHAARRRRAGRDLSGPDRRHGRRPARPGFGADAAADPRPRAGRSATPPSPCGTTALGIWPASTCRA